jgi:hypothetical protein
VAASVAVALAAVVEVLVEVEQVEAGKREK